MVLDRENNIIFFFCVCKKKDNKCINFANLQESNSNATVGLFLNESKFLS